MILAKMLQKFLQKKKAYDKNYIWEYTPQHSESPQPFNRDDIITKFEEIYKNKQNLNQRTVGEGRTGETSVEMLRNLSGSLDVRVSFQRLVPMFLNAVSDLDYSKEKYLVISIDDLDMNSNGFKMLKQIHRYFMGGCKFSCVSNDIKCLELN